MRLATIVVLAFAALSVSCSSDKPSAVAATPPEPQKTFIDPQLQALEKAKAVQGVVDQQKKDADKKLEDAGG
jgi:ABC-type sugar transport system substrate-binding protein